MEDELLMRLYRDDGLQPEAEKQVVVFLPLNYLPSRAETELLDRLLTALNFSKGLRRYAYHEGQPLTEYINQSGAKILFFNDNPDTDPVLIREENPVREWFRLPPLEKILQNQETKKKVWSLLKT